MSKADKINNEEAPLRRIAPRFFALVDAVMFAFVHVIDDQDQLETARPLRILLPSHTWKTIENEISRLPQDEYLKYATPIEMIGDGVLKQFRLLETAYIGHRTPKDERNGS